MNHVIKAIYHNGAFIPTEPCDIAEGAEVELVVKSSRLLPPEEPDPEKRRQIMQELLERMRQNPISADAPRRFTRDEMHERR
ncbi:MAG TPA: antitoxin family protein [Blastocatellia bacterium]|nr:antitoxin family protein [Blastocatellia bacterium]